MTIAVQLDVVNPKPRMKARIFVRSLPNGVSGVFASPGTTSSTSSFVIECSKFSGKFGPTEFKISSRTSGAPTTRTT